MSIQKFLEIFKHSLNFICVRHKGWVVLNKKKPRNPIEENRDSIGLDMEIGNVYCNGYKKNWDRIQKCILWPGEVYYCFTNPVLLKKSLIFPILPPCHSSLPVKIKSYEMFARYAVGLSIPVNLTNTSTS
jgi:hypothetical protein